ncbi:MAG: WD40/YVTN/BNR-like repeat-containing protein [Haloferacaceae archaeon]
MTLILGTRDGVWLADAASVGEAERVCDAETVYGLARTADGWLAAAGTGLYRGDDAATTWERLDVPETVVTAAAALPGADGDGEDAGGAAAGTDERLFAGTRPARLFASDDGGDTWEEVEGFASLPSREQWWNPDVTPHVRSLSTHPDAPGRLVAGIDGGGVHTSADRGATWDERCTAVSGFVHEVRLLTPEEWVVASDAGIFRTRNAGRWWDYLYGDAMEHRYFRGVAVEDGADGPVVYAGGARSHPPVWTGERGADAALYRFDLTERAPEVSQEPYPGEPREIALSGTATPEGVVVGTNEGRLLRRVDDGWTRLGTVPGGPQIRAARTL